MSYIEDKMLAPDEHIEFFVERSRARLHISWVVGIAFFWLLFLPLIKAYRDRMEWDATEYAFTDRNAILKLGWLKDKCNRLALADIERVEVKTSLGGKLFGYGTLILKGRDGNNLYLLDVANVQEVKLRVEALCGTGAIGE